MKIFNTFVAFITNIISVRKVQVKSTDGLPIDNMIIGGIKGILTAINSDDVLLLHRLSEGSGIALQTQLKYKTEEIANAIRENGLQANEDVLLGGIANPVKIVILQNGKISIINGKAQIVMNNDSILIKNTQSNLIPDMVTFLNELKNVKVLNPLTGSFDLPIDPATQSAIQNFITKLESFN